MKKNNKILTYLNFIVGGCLILSFFIDTTMIGTGIILVFLGLVTLTASFLNAEPMGVSVSGLDHLFRKLFKEQYNRLFNFFLGITELVFGIVMLLKLFNE